MMIENKMASGMEVTTTSVERQLPRNSRISIPVSAAAIRPSTTTARIAFATNTDWSNRNDSDNPSGRLTFDSR